MKLSKIIFSVIILLVIVFILASCGIIPSPVTPKAAISGQVLIPPNAGELSKDITGWVPAVNVTVTIIDASGVTHTVTTDDNGYYSFENIAVHPNTIITATATVNGNTVVLKSVIPQAVAADEDHDAGTMTPESTALALVVEKLVEEGVDPEDINLEEIQVSDSFAALVALITALLEDQGDVTKDPDVNDAVGDTVNETLNPSVPPPSSSTSPPASPVTISAIVIDGNAIFNETLTAKPSPAGATANYQWQASTTVDGTYEDIIGATTNTYTLTADEIGKWIKVEANGTGGYTGIVISDHVGPAGKAEAISAPSAPIAFEVTDSSIQLNMINGAEYRMNDGSWQESTSFESLTPNTSYTFYARFQETETHLVSDPSTGTLIKTKIVLSNMGVITGTVTVSHELTAGALTPAEATATYQWQICTTIDGTYEDIPGANLNTYLLAPINVEKWIKVTATGTGEYTGAVTSTSVGPVEAAVITQAAIPGITPPVTGAIPVATITQTAQYSGTVTWNPNHSPFQVNTVYTATITLTPKTGYTLEGVTADFFTVAGATSVANSANSGVVTAIFPETFYSYALRDTGPAGGLIFYINPNYETDGWRYLEAAPVETEWVGKEWGGYMTDIEGTETSIGTGMNNTGIIVAELNKIGQTGKAAQLCYDLEVQNNSTTYNDWFLPSKDELEQIYLNLIWAGVGGFATGNSDYYWSSSQVNQAQAYYVRLSDGSSNVFDKYSAIRVRAVRSF
jgi:hypothetical protein